MRRLVLAATGATILWFYLWTASAGLPFPWGKKLDGYYNLLTESLRHGRLDLPVEPRPELFELIDPYDPAKNASYRLHDVSLYQGRYYLYFGIAPALTLFLPARALGLGDLPEGFAAAVFCFGGFVWAVLLLRHLTQTHLPPLPLWMEWLGAVALGLVNVAPFILRGPEVYDVYHVAIGAGYFFVMGAAYLLSTGRLALGSLFLGLAVASRPNHLFAAPLLLLALPRLRERRGLARALLPFAVCLFLIGAYNRARFGSWTEFGVRYQLAGSHVEKLDTFDSRSILPGLYFYFLSPPRLGREFPFVTLAPHAPGSLPPGYYGPEPIAGVLAHAPLLAILLFARSLLRRAPDLHRPVATLSGIGFLSALVASFVFPSATMRYEVDFVSFLLLPALLLWCLAPARWLLAPLGAYAVLVNVAFSLTGYEDGLKRRNPQAFTKLERLFAPLRAVAGRLPEHDTRAVVRLRIAFPERFAADREPILSSGPDVLFVREAEAGQIVFGLRGRLAPPASVRPGAFYAVEVDLDRSRGRVVVRLDGEETAVLPGPSGPVRRDGIWLGRGPKGGEGWGRFSGAIVSEFQSAASPRGFEPLPDIAPLPAVYAEAPPPAPVRGQLWVKPSADGAQLFDGIGWRWIARPAFDRIRIDRRLVLEAPPAWPEPLVVCGELALRLHPAGRGVLIGFDRWRSEPFGVGTHALSVTLDRPGRLAIVSLDGREALRAAVDLPPLVRAELRVGSPPFSGRLLD